MSTKVQSKDKSKHSPNKASKTVSLEVGILLDGQVPKLAPHPPLAGTERASSMPLFEHYRYHLWLLVRDLLNRQDHKQRLLSKALFESGCTSVRVTCPSRILRRRGFDDHDQRWEQLIECREKLFDLLENANGHPFCVSVEDAFHVVAAEDFDNPGDGSVECDEETPGPEAGATEEVTDGPAQNFGEVAEGTLRGLDVAAELAARRRELMKQLDETTAELTGMVNAAIRQLSNNPTIENANRFFRTFGGIEPSDEAKKELRKTISGIVRRKEGVLKHTKDGETYPAYLSAIKKKDRKGVRLHVASVDGNEQKAVEQTVPSLLYLDPILDR
ncbi:hypothetical protein [Rhodopirellula sp. MGV]|uniref:hypothetical protein n=1 Tax=Rhodopirellula sp. MGV TaxID=2023130 RepID=UPI000B96E394|nr:hypothetical protein [Rhodopirellula sp. MGV]OYP28495.1 hypothetical protein CGZ80_27225 [Rhodopirellula sp. MGV]PNY38627.1 hypothetical protein C2E31_01545 [Rhodopirellula baltica]